MPPDELATLRTEIKDFLAIVALVLQKIGAPTIDLANLIVEDPIALVEPTPEPIIPVAP